MIELLEDDHPGGLAHDEAVTPGVERAGARFRIVVALRERSHRTEPRDSDVGDGRLGAAAQHDLRTTEANRVESVADRHVRGGASGAFGGEWALRAELHRNPGCSHVRDDLDDRERGRAIRAAIDEPADAILERGETADPGGDGRADAVRARG